MRAVLAVQPVMKLCALGLVAAAWFGLGVMAGLAKPPSPAASAVSPQLGTNSVVLRTNLARLGRHSPGFALNSPAFVATIAPPGVYVSEPYKSLVVVPGPHPDDRCLITGGGPTVPMPMRRPNLRLLPFGK